MPGGGVNIALVGDGVGGIRVGVGTVDDVATGVGCVGVGCGCWQETNHAPSPIPTSASAASRPA